MKISNRTLRIFYQHLAEVFYAVAAIDQTVKKKEVDELKKIVKSEWLSIDDRIDEYGTNMVYYILLTFDLLERNKWDVKTMIPRLKTYKKENQELFTKEVNQLILKTSYSIASAFSDRNKSELVLLSQLETLLA